MSDERQAVERMKNEFVSMVSHELRTPMNGVIGMISLLLRRQLGPREREYAEAARQAAEALLAIINDILDLSKIEAGRLEVEHGPVDVRSVVEDVTVLLAEQARRKGLEIVCAVDRNVPADLAGDMNRVRQILINLVGNAVKFTDAGEVVVRAVLADDDPHGPVVRLEVKDTGIGISHEQREGLFRAFSQVDSSMIRRTGGTGLGLAISRRLAELMGGAVGFESQPGRGSTFWATIHFSRWISSAVAPPRVAAPELRGCRVLVVDHNPTSRSILTQQLEALHIQAESAGDGASALSRLRDGVAQRMPFALALLDRDLGDMDGLQLARHILADPQLAGTRQVLLNRLGESPRGEELAAAGVAASLEKPVRQAALVETLTRVVTGEQRDNSGEADSRAASPLQLAALAPRVLLVEDVPMNRHVAASMLGELGFEVDVAANGREALEVLDMHLNEAPYVAVLMDCQMPEMDGFETTAAIRQLPSARCAIPIIAMTAGAMRGDREWRLAAGMDDYLAKPLRLDTLARVLRRRLPRRLASSDRGDAVDLAALSELAHQLDRSGAGDGGALVGMIAEFRAEATARLQKLRQAVSLDDPAALKEAAHGLRGPATVLGAREVHGLAARLEQLGREESLAGADALIDQLDSAVARASGALHTELATRAGVPECAC